MVVGISTNEREWQGEVLGWFQKRLPLDPFKHATQEIGVEGQFPDMVLWHDRNANSAAVAIELKTVETSARDPELLKDGNNKAKNLSAKVLVTWNMAELIVWAVRDVAPPSELWHYDTISISNGKQWQKKEAELKKLARDLLVDLAQYLRDGTPPSHGHVDSTVFIEGIHRTVRELVPLFQAKLTADFTNVVKWCAAQGIASDDGFETAARHAVYRIVGKLLFYQTLARVRGDLRPISLGGKLLPARTGEKIRKYFQAAKKIDYQALFDEDLPDLIPFDQAIADRIERFCRSFLPLNLPTMQLDVVGRIFEALVPEDEKKTLGQYFTEPWLADLIVTAAIRSRDDSVFDPTCGTGGILLRAYAFLKRLGRTEHGDLLDVLWGNDIGTLPTELGMINMFRQDPQQIENFPRILRHDIFDLAPRMSFDLLPSREGGGVKKITVAMPEYDAVIGNPPYLRRQEIGAGQADPVVYKKNIWKTFPQFDHVSDLYVFVFAKAAEFLKAGGRLCFVTGNSWLDSEYGLELQRYFLTQFKLIAVFESRCEPWFENAEVNTVVTVLEKLANPIEFSATLPADVSDHQVAFVKLKKTLQNMAGAPLDDPVRFDRFARMHADVSNALSDFENDTMRVRKRTQGYLYAHLPSPGHISKWGIYLRAPRAFFKVISTKPELTNQLGAVVDTRFGTLSGKNEFYCPRSSDSAYPLFQKVAQKYRIPLIRSYKDCDDYELRAEHCEGELFVCDEDFKNIKDSGARKFIEWGRRQKDDGVLWPEAGEMKNREPWYSTRDPVRGDVVFQMFIGAKHAVPINPKRYAVLNNLLVGDARDKAKKEILRCLLNSTWFALCCELYGRINLGGGALKIEKADLDVMPLPRFDLFSDSDVAEMTEALLDMRKREVGVIEAEVKQADRRRLDKVVFDRLGLTGDEQEEIYAAVVELCQDRHKLATIRKLRKSEQRIKDVKLVIEDILQESAADGFLHFPDDFIKPTNDWKKVNVPAGGIRLVGAPAAPGQSSLFGKEHYHLEGDDEFSAELDHKEMVDYLHYAQNGKQREVLMPPSAEEAAELVAKYLAYASEAKKKVLTAVFERVLDGRRADQIAKRILDENSVRTDPVPIRIPRRRK